MKTTGYWWTALRRHWRLGVWLYVVLVLLTAGGSWAQGAPPERRTALVIGNSAYRKSPLENPLNDAQSMAATLESLGFTITKLENASKGEMSAAIQTFGENIQHGGVGLFYFAGHGVQIHGENFLIPVDDDIQDKDQVATKGIEAKAVLLAMSKAKNRLNIVILDACRNNPFGQGASRGLIQTDNVGNLVRSDSAGGLAAMEALVGTFIAFATAPESVAADGRGKNGIYTENLLRYIVEPGIQIEDVFKRTRFAVRQATNGRQVPWENTSLEGDFYFVAPPTGGTTSSGATGQSTDLGHQQPSTLQSKRSGIATANPGRSLSGFSFSREEAKDQAALTAKDDAIRARWQVPCAESLRQRPIVIDITEESHANGLAETERSTRFAQLVHQNLQQAGLATSLANAQKRSSGSAKTVRASRSQGNYSINGVVLSQQGANSVVRLQEASVNAELTLQDPSGRILTLVEVSGESFAGQNSSAATWTLTKEKARDASSQLYEAFCGSGIGR